MSSIRLRKSLLALSIAAALPSLAAADVECLSGGMCTVPGGTHNLVNVGSGVTISDTFGIDNSSSSSITTLNNSGSISGTSVGIYNSNSSITTLNNSGSISGFYGFYLESLGAAMTINHNDGAINGTDSAVYAIAAGQAVTLNWNGGTISGNISGLKTLNLNQDHASLDGNGNLFMADGSTIRMRLTADNATPVLYLNGYSYNLGTGSQILLRPSASNFSVTNQTYTLIAAEGFSAPGLNVLSESPYLTVNSFLAGGNLTANVSIAAAPQITQAGGSPNAQAAGNAISPLLSAMAISNPGNPVLEALSGSDAVRTSEQLVPDVNGGALLGANTLNYQADLNAGQRTQGLRGASAGDAFVERGLWIKALNSNAKQDERAGIAGFDADSNGIAIGADGKLNDQLTLGLAYSYLNSDIDSDNGNQTEIDGHAITLYSGYEQDAWFLDSSLTVGLNHNDSTRYIAGTKAQGDYDSQLFGLNVLGGYGFQLDNGVLLEPRAAARYGRVDIDSYGEKGSIAALDVGSQRYEVAELGAGLRVAGNLPLGKGTLQPEAKVMVYHDFAADQVSSDASFVFGGSSFVANGATPARTRYEAGVGLEYKLAATTFGVSYDYSGKQDFNADTFQAKVRYDF
jgi:outer membrane autotransporter protein